MLENSIIHGDCLEVMATIPDASVDMILCDLPYGTTEASWDSLIPLESLWREYLRITKAKSTFIFTASQPFTTTLINSNARMFKYEVIWSKTRSMGFLHAKNKPLKIHENILVFSKGTTIHASQSNNRMTYNPQMRTGLKPYSKTQKSERRGKTWGGDGRAPEKETTTKSNGERYPTSVVEFANPNNHSLHPTQKPVDLFEYLIKTFSSPGDLVLDNCIGSGTTAIAALNTGRRFIGIESDLEYFNVAQKRLSEHVGRIEEDF